MEKVEGSTIYQKWKILEATRAEAGKYSQETPREVFKILHIWHHMEHLRSFEPAPPCKNFSSFLLLGIDKSIALCYYNYRKINQTKSQQAQRGEG